MMRFASTAVLILVAAGHVRSANAGQTVSTSAVTSCSSESPDNSSYRLRAGDVLGIDFRFTPDFNTSATIRPDGRIAMSGIGDVTAAGLTPRQLTCALQDAYRTFLHDPIISVSTRNLENPSFIVGGEVERPGKYELRRDTTITEAIAIAGGFKRSAKRSEVYLFRRAAGSGEIAPQLLDVKAMLESREVARDFRLESEDMVFVPQTGFSKVERFIPMPGFGFFFPVR